MHQWYRACLCAFVFFFNDTATTEIYTLSLHDALPICSRRLPKGRTVKWMRTERRRSPDACGSFEVLKSHLRRVVLGTDLDRKSTRLNSSHANISYAVFCLKKKACLLRASV